jgi:hypothetical protein
MMKKLSYLIQKDMLCNVVVIWKLMVLTATLSLTKNVKSRARMCLADEHLNGCMRIATKEMNHSSKSCAKYGVLLITGC